MLGLKPKHSSSLASLLGISSMEDLLLFLSATGLVYSTISGEFKISLKSIVDHRNNTNRTSWHDFMVQNDLDNKYFI